jgi:hypothetical protein
MIDLEVRIPDDGHIAFVVSECAGEGGDADE